MSRSTSVRGSARESTAPDAVDESAGRAAHAAYFERSQLPLPSLLFLLPLIVLYEVGTLYFANDAHSHTETRLLAFNFLQTLFGWFHISSRYLPALAVVGILLTWHIARNDRWNFEWKTPALMAGEALVLTLPLLALNCLTVKYVPLANQKTIAPTVQQRPSQNMTAGRYSTPYAAPYAVAPRIAPTRPFNPATPGSSRPPSPPPAYSLGSRPVVDFVLSIGAGIYEELMFRLVVFTLLTLLLIDALKMPKGRAIVIMVLASALLFAGYHYLGDGEAFNWRTFVFRTGAGIYFGYLFFARGFGVTAGCHTAYDLMVFLIRLAVVHA